MPVRKSVHILIGNFLCIGPGTEANWGFDQEPNSCEGLWDGYAQVFKNDILATGHMVMDPTYLFSNMDRKKMGKDMHFPADWQNEERFVDLTHLCSHLLHSSFLSHSTENLFSKVWE